MWNFLHLDTFVKKMKLGIRLIDGINGVGSSGEQHSRFLLPNFFHMYDYTPFGSFERMGLGTGVIRVGQPCGVRSADAAWFPRDFSYGFFVVCVCVCVCVCS